VPLQGCRVDDGTVDVRLRGLFQKNRRCHLAEVALHEASQQQSPVPALDSHRLSERHKEEESVSHQGEAELFPEARPEKVKWPAMVEVPHENEYPFGHFVQ